MELGDYRAPERMRTGGDASPRVPLLAIGALVLIVASAAIYYYVQRRGVPPPANTTAATEVPLDAPAAPAPLGADAEPRDVPPLDASDAFVRDLLAGLSSYPALAAWLATDGLVRNFVVSVDNVASGRTPARHLKVLAPRGPFEAERRDGGYIESARAQARFDGIAGTVASLDARELARIYTILKPRLDEAYAELGRPLGTFDAAVERAIVHLLQTPVRSAAIVPSAGGVSYRYADPAIEALSPAQKQLLRMGPTNAARVQEKLREIALELGVPGTRLP